MEDDEQRARGRRGNGKDAVGRLMTPAGAGEAPGRKPGKLDRNNSFFSIFAGSADRAGKLTVEVHFDEVAGDVKSEAFLSGGVELNRVSDELSKKFHTGSGEKVTRNTEKINPEGESIQGRWFQRCFGGPRLKHQRDSTDVPELTSEGTGASGIILEAEEEGGGVERLDINSGTPAALRSRFRETPNAVRRGMDGPDVRSFANKMPEEHVLLEGL